MANDYGISDEDRKRQMYEAIMMAGFGLLGTPRGQEWQGIGRAGLLGMGAYNQGLRDTRKDNLAAAAEKRAALSGELDTLKLQQLRQGIADDDELRKMWPTMGQQQPARPMDGAGAYGVASGGMPMPPQAQAPAAAPTAPTDAYGQLMAIAAQLDAVAQRTGNPKAAAQAEAYREKALKFRDENQSPVETYDPVTKQMKFIQPRKFGSPVDIAGAVPPPKYTEIDQGDRKLFRDLRTGQTGGEFGVNVSPNTLSSNANAMAIARMTDARAREGQAITAAGQSKPQWDSVNQVWVAPPTGMVPGSAAAPSGELPGGQKKTIAATTAMSIVDKARPLIEAATGSYVGSGIDQLARVFGGSTEGSLAIGKLKVLEAALVMNQPRMEGPQSDKDVLLYKEAAGQIGDPTVPNEQKMQALEQIRGLHQLYGGIYGGDSGPRAASGKISTALTPEQKAQADAAYAALPSGAVFIGPDGKRRRKP